VKRNCSWHRRPRPPRIFLSQRNVPAKGGARWTRRKLAASPARARVVDRLDGMRAPIVIARRAPASTSAADVPDAHAPGRCPYLRRVRVYTWRHTRPHPICLERTTCLTLVYPASPRGVLGRTVHGTILRAAMASECASPSKAPKIFRERKPPLCAVCRICHNCLRPTSGDCSDIVARRDPVRCRSRRREAWPRPRSFCMRATGEARTWLRAGVTRRHIVTVPSTALSAPRAERPRRTGEG